MKKYVKLFEEFTNEDGNSFNIKLNKIKELLEDNPEIGKRIEIKDDYCDGVIIELVVYMDDVIARVDLGTQVENTFVSTFTEEELDLVLDFLNKPKHIEEAEDTTNQLQLELINPQNIQKAKTELANNKIPYSTVLNNASTFFRFRSIPDFKKGSKVIYAVVDRKKEVAEVAPK